MSGTEIEEKQIEHIKDFLTKENLFEEGMDSKEMIQVYTAVKESKQDAEGSMYQNSQPQTPPGHPPNEELENVSPPEISTKNISPESKRSYSNAVESNKSSSENMVRARSENNEINSTSESNDRSHKKEQTPKPNLTKKTDSEKKMEKRKKLQLDPLNIKTNEDEKPLCKPERLFINESEPFSLCSDLKNSEFTPKELVNKISDYLQQVRDEWIAYNIPAADDKEFMWGSPIKVGTRNFSLDRKLMTKSEPEEAEQLNDLRPRASKRKAASLIATITNTSDNETEDDDDSALLKKRKPQQERRNATPSENEMHMDIDQEPKHSEDPRTSLSFSTDNKIQLSEEEEDIFEFQTKNKSPNIFYPIRVVPPNPGINKARRGKARIGKPNYKGPRAKKSTESSKKTPEKEKTISSEKVSLPDIILDNDNDVEFDDLSKPTDIKMLKMPIKERTKLASKKLEDLKNRERERIEQKKFHANLLQENTRKQQEEAIKKQLEAEQEAKRLAKEREEKENEKKKIWNKVLNDRVQRREKPKGLRDEEVRGQLEEDEIVLCDDQLPEHMASTTSENRVPCPICNKFFPESDIQNHASECDQFECIDEEISSPVIGMRRRKANVIKQKCEICRSYETYDANDFFEHIQLCAEANRKQNEQSVVCTFKDSSFF